MLPRKPIVHQRTEGERAKRGIRASIQLHQDCIAWKLTREEAIAAKAARVAAGKDDCEAEFEEDLKEGAFVEAA